MRLFAKVVALLTDDVDQIQELLDQTVVFDDDDATRVSTYQAGKVVLANAQADYQVSFGGVGAASLLLIVAKDEVQVRLNDPAAPLIYVRPTLALPEGSVILSAYQKLDQPGVVLWRGRIDSVYLTNPSATATATVYVALVGEAS